VSECICDVCKPKQDKNEDICGNYGIIPAGYLDLRKTKDMKEGKRYI